jgi:hypothetical protein
MTTEELLKKRYKVIAPVPFHTVAGFNKIPVGFIFEYDEFNPLGCEFPCKFIDYPRIFKELFWWEEREEKDMPEYVKVISCAYNIDYNRIGKD